MGRGRRGWGDRERGNGEGEVEEWGEEGKVGKVHKKEWGGVGETGGGAVGRRLGWDRGEGEMERGNLKGEMERRATRRGRREGGAKGRGRRTCKRRGHFTDGCNGIPGWICAIGLSCKQIGLGRQQLWRSLIATTTCNAEVE